MKIQIQVAVNYQIVNHKTIDITLPDTAVYYSKNDDGNFFPRGLILFAIIPYKEGSKHFTLIQVERNKQDYNDFVPHDDCKQEFWLKTYGIRKQAFDILTKYENDGFKPISEDEFNTKRIELLNNYQK